MSRTNGRANKDKGNNAERHYSHIFQTIGFTKCRTSRYGSKLHDDSGIDLINLPFNVQIKAGIQRGLDPSAVLQDIKNRLELSFPENSVERQAPLIIIHKKNAKGRKRTPFEEIVHMSFEDFLKLIHLAYGSSPFPELKSSSTLQRRPSPEPEQAEIFDKETTKRRRRKRID